jgi:hypothetical protein
LAIDAEREAQTVAAGDFERCQEHLTRQFSATGKPIGPFGEQRWDDLAAGSDMNPAFSYGQLVRVFCIMSFVKEY